ncbi:LysR family transcriptional regulator [Rhodovibrionaceae bacterium A322]
MALPPLNALRAFEAAARTGGYVSAAQELQVTAAAVSQQVRNLEEFLGKKLFNRSANSIALTDAGRSLYPNLARALADIRSVADKVAQNHRPSRMIVSVLPSVAEHWFLPTLAASGQPEVLHSLDIRVEEDPVDFQQERIDLRLTYGTFGYPDLKVVPLFQDQVVPLCHPDFWDTYGDPSGTLENVDDAQLIHINWGPNFASLPNWSQWFAAQDLNRRPQAESGLRVGPSGLALVAARSGVGMALGQAQLAAPALTSGQLVAPCSGSLPLGHPYCAVFPYGKQQDLRLQRLLKLLQGSAA